MIIYVSSINKSSVNFNVFELIGDEGKVLIADCEGVVQSLAESSLKVNDIVSAWLQYLCEMVSDSLDGFVVEEFECYDCGDAENPACLLASDSFFIIDVVFHKKAEG